MNIKLPNRLHPDVHKVMNTDVNIARVHFVNEFLTIAEQFFTETAKRVIEDISPKDFDDVELTKGIISQRLHMFNHEVYDAGERILKITISKNT